MKHISDVGEKGDLKLHVKADGIFLSGGIYVNGHYEETDDKKKWTHLLLLLFSPFPTRTVRSAKGYGEKKIYDYKQHTTRITISKYYIFYKYFSHK